MQAMRYSPSKPPDDVTTEDALLPTKDTDREKSPEKNLASDGDADNAAEGGNEVTPLESSA